MNEVEAEKFKKLKGLIGNTVSRNMFVCTATPVDITKGWPPPVDAVTEHVEFMKGLEADGRLFTSGPFLDDAGERTADGMFILEVPDLATAEELIAADPFIAQGYRTVEIRPWQLNETRGS
jgi:uncharacterized protein YciI